jgi:hypothetical protein
VDLRQLNKTGICLDPIVEIFKLNETSLI